MDFQDIQKQQRLQQEASTRLNNELLKHSIDLKENLEYEKWYDYAIKALDMTSPSRLQISMEGFEKLFEFEQDKHHKKVTLFNIAMLANNLEERTAWELEMEMDEYRQLLKLNSKIAEKWNSIVEPIKESISTQMKLMSGTSFGNKLIKAQA